jgi:hypothetical protein
MRLPRPRTRPTPNRRPDPNPPTREPHPHQYQPPIDDESDDDSPLTQTGKELAAHLIAGVLLAILALLSWWLFSLLRTP